jgi:hypothetical protein
MNNTSDVQLRGAAPVFVVNDVLRSVEHYCEVLGFHTEFLYAKVGSSPAKRR